MSEYSVKRLVSGALGAIALSTIPLAAASATSKAANQYLSDVKAVNAAITTFDAQVAKWHGQQTMRDQSKTVAPVVRAYADLQRKLLSQNWPSTSRRAITALYNDTTALNGDMEALSFTNVFNQTAWGTKYSQDSIAFAATVNVVRHDLGLPLR